MRNYNQKDKIFLLESATKEFVSVRAKDGVLDPIALVLFFRLHELAGYPVESKYYTFRQEELVKKEEALLGLTVREVGAYLDLFRIAKFYGLKEKTFHDAVEENCLNYLKFDFDKNRDGTVVFRVSDVYGNLGDFDYMLGLDAKIHNLRSIKQLLEIIKKKENDQD